MKKYCQKCNKVFDEQKKYCPYCGNQLIEKEESIVEKKEDEKEQEIKNPDDTIHYITMEEIVSFKYNSTAKVFLLPVTIGMGILEMLFLGLFLSKGIPKVITNSWLEAIVFLLLFIGVAKFRKWTIYKFSGNSQMKMFGIAKNTLQSIEGTFVIIYSIIVIICGVALLDYFGITLNGIVNDVGMALDVVETYLNDPSEIEGYMNYGREIGREIGRGINSGELIIPLTKFALIELYELKNWLMLLTCSSIVYQETTVYHKVEEDELEILSAFKKTFYKIKEEWEEIHKKSDKK